jgi:hypothetical protein
VSLAGKGRLLATLTSYPAVTLRIHSIVKDLRFLRCGAAPVLLDKAGGDMVHLPRNLRPPKENKAAKMTIHLLL